MMRWRIVERAVLIACVVGIASEAVGQRPAFVVPVAAGAESERYLRVLQLLGRLPDGQWAIRPFTLSEDIAVRSATGPWTGRLPDGTAGPHGWSAVSPSLGFIFNSSFPYGFNDGPVWAGKGVTAAGSAGVAARAGRFSLVLTPSAFIAQNAKFRLGTSLETGQPTLANWNRTLEIDLPQRFGYSSYGRIDAGESRVAFDSPTVAMGLANSAQVWGPAVDEPLILGNNAGGFPHLFVGTGAPVNAGIGRLHAKVIWGRLDQSPYANGTDSTARHWATGVVGSIVLNEPQGVELGAARFFHTVWGKGRLSDVPWTRAFELLFKNQLIRPGNPSGDNSDNQLASVFFRWAPHALGFEAYGEYGREDHSADVRDFLGEPDHDAAYTLGFQRAWLGEDATTVSVFRAEILNSRLGHLSGQNPWYIHGAINQGHTEHGQLLAAPGGYGGGATTIAYDRYTPDGRKTIRFDRLLVAEDQLPSGLPNSLLTDVSYALRFERSRFTRGGELVTSIGIIRELNRYFSGDAWNLNVASSFTMFHLGGGK